MRKQTKQLPLGDVLPTERKESVSTMDRIRNDAERIARHFNLKYKEIKAERPNATGHYGVCYDDGRIHIRLRHAKTGKLLRYSSLVNTLCHELAHLKYFDHGDHFKRFYFTMLRWAREEKIYKPKAAPPPKERPRRPKQQFRLFGFLLVLLLGCHAPPTSVEPITAQELTDLVKSAPAKATLVNIWATWCIPCREEFPFLLDLQNKYRDGGLKVIFVSADFAGEIGQVKKFLKQQGVTDRTYIKNEGDNVFISAIHTAWSGSLPATFIYDATGTPQAFFEGEVAPERLETAVTKILKAP